MENLGVIPDVITTAPKEVAKVQYSTGVNVDLGNVLTPTQVKKPPNVSWTAESDAFYTLCMTDPDAPSRKEPKFREWHHWLVGNIPGCNIAAGEVLSAYIGAGPPKGSGLHRYVILVYKQPGKLKFDENKLPKNSGKNRAKFSIQKFASKYKLGQPIAGNAFQAEWDEYVPILYKSFKD